MSLRSIVGKDGLPESYHCTVATPKVNLIHDHGQARSLCGQRRTKATRSANALRFESRPTGFMLIMIEISSLGTVDVLSFSRYPPFLRCSPICPPPHVLF